MLVVKNSKSVCLAFFSFVLAYAAALRAQQREQRCMREMQRLDAHLLEDIGFRRQDDNVLVPITVDNADANNALVRSHRRQARLRSAFLVRRRQALRNRRSGP